ncbi:MAG: hypothetical protein ACYDGR_10685, partial [Candidatus Dormibacteria bacterium]
MSTSALRGKPHFSVALSVLTILVASLVGARPAYAAGQAYYVSSVSTPAATPSGSATLSGTLPVGTYAVDYTFVSAYGETASSPLSGNIVLASGAQEISIAAVSRPCWATAVRWYIAAGPSGTTGYAVQNSGAAFILNSVGNGSGPPTSTPQNCTTSSSGGTQASPWCDFRYFGSGQIPGPTRIAGDQVLLNYGSCWSDGAASSQGNGGATVTYSRTGLADSSAPFVTPPAGHPSWTGANVFVNNAVGVVASNTASTLTLRDEWANAEQWAPSFAPAAGTAYAIAMPTHFLEMGGNGTSAASVTLAAYGNSALGKPRILGLGGTQGQYLIWINNPSYWTIGNLELGNADGGLVAFYQGSVNN